MFPGLHSLLVEHHKDLVQTRVGLLRDCRHLTYQSDIQLLISHCIRTSVPQLHNNHSQTFYFSGCITPQCFIAAICKKGGLEGIARGCSV